MHLEADRPDSQHEIYVWMRAMASAKVLDELRSKKLVGYLKKLPQVAGAYKYPEDIYIEGWCTVQQTIVLPAAEEDLHGTRNGSAKGSWMKYPLRDLGVVCELTTRTNSSAAKGTTARLGSGRVLHLQIVKIGEAKKPTDNPTKYLDAKRLTQLVEALPARRISW